MLGGGASTPLSMTSGSTPLSMTGASTLLRMRGASTPLSMTTVSTLLGMRGHEVLGLFSGKFYPGIIRVFRFPGCVGCQG